MGCTLALRGIFRSKFQMPCSAFIMRSTGGQFLLFGLRSTRVARCLTNKMAGVCPIHGKFLAKRFETGNAIGNVDLSILNVFCNSYLIHTLQIF